MAIKLVRYLRETGPPKPIGERCGDDDLECDSLLCRGGVCSGCDPDDSSTCGPAQICERDPNLNDAYSCQYQDTRVIVLEFSNQQELLDYIDATNSDDQPYDPISKWDFPQGYDGSFECLHVPALGYIICGGNQQDSEIETYIDNHKFPTPEAARAFLEEAGYSPYIPIPGVTRIGDYGKAYEHDERYRYQVSIRKVDGECSWIITYNEGPEPDIQPWNCIYFYWGCAAVYDWHSQI